MTLKEFVLSKRLEQFIIIVILFNAVTLGMETSHDLMEKMGTFLKWADHIALAIFTIEIILKIVCLKVSYFKNPWNIFDFLIVALSYVPSAGGLSVLRSLRVLRIFLLISAMPKLKLIVRSLIVSLPSIGSIVLLLTLMFYVCGVIATNIFGNEFPDWFGSLPKSLFTLFQIMTLESWAMGIVRPICEQFPYAPLFFIPFVLLSSFIILNVFIAVIINAMSEVREHTQEQARQASIATEKELDKLYLRLDDIGNEIKEISLHLKNKK